MFGFGNFGTPPRGGKNIRPQATMQPADESVGTLTGVLTAEGTIAGENNAPNLAQIELVDVVLVSKEDIYTREGQQMVLLLKRGREITMAELPRFIRHGVNPKQFRIKSLHQSTTASPDLNLSSSPAGYDTNPAALNPMTPISRASKTVRKHKAVLILDTDAKSMRRTMDCLFRCGFTLSRIHPVRMPAHLTWAVSKYAPDVLVVDYHLEGGHNALTLIRELSDLPAQPDQILLTLSMPDAASEEEQRMIHEAADRFGIRVLLKPLNRYAINTLLDQQGT